MNTQHYNPRQLKLLDFVQQGATLDGQTPLSEMGRLLSYDTVAPQAELADPLVSWHVVGELQQGSGGAVKTYLQLLAQVELMMRCERCLEPVACKVEVQRRLRFVKDEEIAAQLDTHDDEEDVLAMSLILNLLELVEDELIMALPLAPHHEHCDWVSYRGEAAQAAGPAANAEAAADAPHPFAALAALKNKPKPN